MLISLKDIDEGNFEVCARLKVREDQPYVAPNVVSIAQAKVQPNWIIKAICADEDIVGFAMYEIDRRKGELNLYRFMIDKNHQGKGYGTSALGILRSIAEGTEGIIRMRLSTNPKNAPGIRFYERFGFVDARELEADEEVFVLDLDEKTREGGKVLRGSSREAPRTDTLIHRRVEASREGRNPAVICRMPSGWAVLSDSQFLRGYSILLSDPVVVDLNALDEARRSLFLLDMAILGDALLEVTGAYLINYEILGNTERALHAHVLPRYLSEPEEFRKGPAWFYEEGYRQSVKLDPDRDAALKARIAEAIGKRGGISG